MKHHLEVFRVTELSDYGKPLVVYHGAGILQMENGDQLHCTCELAQVSDGRLYALCQIEEADVHKGMDGAASILDGRTEDGKNIRFECIRIVRNISSYSQEGASRHVVLYGKQVTVDSGTVPQGPVLFRFPLTNLTLCCTQGYALHHADRSVPEGLQSSWELDGLGVAIHRTRDYDDIIRNLRATRGVDVTCEAVVSASSAQELETVRRVVTDLCLLLTLARGCRIEWLSYTVEAPDGQVLKSYHRGNAITKPFGTLDLIAHEPAEDTVDFVSKAYPNLNVRGKPWLFREAVDLYTDAKSEQDFFELRGLKMVIVMEHLKGCYLRQHGKSYILEHEAFENGRECLVKVVRSALPDLFPNATDEQLDMMSKHAQGLNWYPFRRAISDLCASTGLDFNSTERGRFVDIRNELVHRVEYNPNYGDSWSQYFFLMTFVGRILLAILGYDGYYYDWTKHGGAEMKSDIRVKLDLSPGRTAQG